MAYIPKKRWDFGNVKFNLEKGYVIADLQGDCWEVIDYNEYTATGGTDEIDTPCTMRGYKVRQYNNLPCFVRRQTDYFTIETI